MTSYSPKATCGSLGDVVEFIDLFKDQYYLPNNSLQPTAITQDNFVIDIGVWFILMCNYKSKLRHS